MNAKQKMKNFKMFSNNSLKFYMKKTIDFINLIQSKLRKINIVFIILMQMPFSAQSLLHSNVLFKSI